MRIDLNDTPAAAVLRLADGDRAAALACVAMVKAVETVDPAAGFGPFTPLLMLDRFDIAGPAIGRLYLRLAGRDAATAIALLHAVRLKLVPLETLKAAIAGDSALVDGPATLERVRAAIPGFAPLSSVGR